MCKMCVRKDRISKRFPGLEILVEKLWKILSTRTDISLLHLFGEQMYLASELLKEILHSKKIAFIEVDCSLLATERCFFEAAIAKTGDLYNRCCFIKETVMHTFAKILLKKFRMKKKIYLIIQNLQNLHKEMLSILLLLPKFKEMTGLNICSVTLSEFPWPYQACRSTSGGTDVFEIGIPHITMEKVINNIIESRPYRGKNNLYKKYVQLYVDILRKYSSSEFEMKFIIERNYVKFLESAEKCANCRKFSKNDTRFTWEALKPVVKEHNQYRFLFNFNVDREKQYDQLPLYEKYLLISGYIASYNPERTDRRYFVKLAEKSRVRRKEGQRENSAAHLLGPKIFTEERMLSIFFYLLRESHADISMDLFSSIRKLCNYGYLSRASSIANMNTARYRCLASFNILARVASAVGIELTDFLYDVSSKKLF
ncbi:Origin recognition complex subunit 5 [Trichinella papuae]|uniref:Origin recognition complex subunit 5 n=1 Tax=Trichinella papuae TaxID=268474 RepID=A0A0V1MDD2_9BILA|nr:Origin recognition complex subunit 5 [Trichinella papuae]